MVVVSGTAVVVVVGVVVVVVVGSVVVTTMTNILKNEKTVNNRTKILYLLLWFQEHGVFPVHPLD